MGQIFLSYAREDRGAAQILARVVEGAGHDVWWDRHIDGGEEFADQIEAALDKAEIVLVAWSRESVRSRWVRDEAAAGGDTGRLLPVSIDGSMPPMGFRQFHTMDLAGWKGSKRDGRTAELVQSIERRLNGKPDATVAPASRPGTKNPFALGKWGWAAAAVAGLAILAAALLTLFGNPFGSGPGQPTIAIGAFSATTSDPATRELAIRSRDSLAHAFAESGTAVKLVDAATPAGGKPPADYILSAEISSEPDKILALIRMDDASQHATVWTRQIEQPRKAAADLPDRIGAQVTGSLNWAGTLRFLKPGDADYTAKLLQLDVGREPLENYQNASRFAAQQPNSAMAQLALAMYTAFALGQLPLDQRKQAIVTGLQAAARAKSIAPHFGDVYLPSCLLRPQIELAQCEDQLRAGLKADPDAPFVNFFLSDQLNAVGRNDDAGNHSDLSYEHDPFMPAKIEQELRMLELSGNTRQADAIYATGQSWWPQWAFYKARAIGILERGDFDALHHVETLPGAAGYGPHRNSDELVAAVRAKSVPELKRACIDPQGLYGLMCMIAYAKIGDEDDAYLLADQYFPRQVGRTPAETEQLWIADPEGESLREIASPGAAPMRLDPRYLDLAERTGLLAYWRTGRLPDFCRQHPEPVCARLRRS